MIVSNAFHLSAHTEELFFSQIISIRVFLNSIWLSILLRPRSMYMPQVEQIKGRIFPASLHQYVLSAEHILGAGAALEAHLPEL